MKTSGAAAWALLSLLAPCAHAQGFATYEQMERRLEQVRAAYSGSLRDPLSAVRDLGSTSAAIEGIVEAITRCSSRRAPVPASPDDDRPGYALAAGPGGVPVGEVDAGSTGLRGRWEWPAELDRFHADEAATWEAVRDMLERGGIGDPTLAPQRTVASSAAAPTGAGEAILRAVDGVISLVRLELETHLYDASPLDTRVQEIMLEDRLAGLRSDSQLQLLLVRHRTLGNLLEVWLKKLDARGAGDVSAGLGEIQSEFEAAATTSPTLYDELRRALFRQARLWALLHCAPRERGVHR